MQIYIHLLLDLCPLLPLTGDFLHDCVTTIIGSVYVYENPTSVFCHSCIIKILTNVRQQQNQRNTNMPVARRICISFILALSAVN